MDQNKLNKLLNAATIELVVEQDDEAVQGHFSSGDDEADTALEDEIIARLDRDDIWAWCVVKVVATLGIEDTQYRGESHFLGACSYKNERDFKGGGYFDDMKEEALNALAEQLQSRPLDPCDVKVTRDSQRQALADMVNRKLKYRSLEVEAIRNELLNILKPCTDTSVD